MLDHMSMPVLFALVFIILGLVAAGVLIAPRMITARRRGGGPR